MKKGNKLEFYSGIVLYWTLIAIPVTASFSSALVNILIGFGITSYALNKISWKNLRLAPTFIGMPFIFLILVSFLSFFNSISIAASWGGIFKLAKYGFVILILADGIRDERHFRKIIFAVILGLGIASLDGIYQLAFGKDLFRHRPYDIAIGLPRLKAAFPHTNIFASYLGLFLPLAAALAYYYFKGRAKIFSACAAISGLFCLIFTFSRGAVIGFLASLFFMAIVKKDKLVLILLIIVFLTAPFLLPHSVHDWVKSTDSFWEVLLNKERLNIFKTALNMISAHPVIGVGVNTFCLNYQKYKIQETSGFTGDAMYYAHNIYLHMAGEIGIIGLVLFLWLLWILFRKWRLFYKSANVSEFFKICSLGIISGILCFLINGLTETNLYYPKVAVLFWYQVGLFLGMLNLTKGHDLLKAK